MGIFKIYYCLWLSFMSRFMMALSSLDFSISSASMWVRPARAPWEPSSRYPRVIASSMVCRAWRCPVVYLESGCLRSL